MMLYSSCQWLLPCCFAGAALLLYILLDIYLKRETVRTSACYKAHTEALPAKCAHTPTSSATVGKSFGTSTPRNRRTRLPDYPRHRNWRLKGARRNCRKKIWRKFRTKLLILSPTWKRKAVKALATNNRQNNPDRTLEEASGESFCPA